jgi:hypothetical protein
MQTICVLFCMQMHVSMTISPGDGHSLCGECVKQTRVLLSKPWGMHGRLALSTLLVKVHSSRACLFPESCVDYSDHHTNVGFRVLGFVRALCEISAINYTQTLSLAGNPVRVEQRGCQQGRRGDGERGAREERRDRSRSCGV